jgi:hypothetical protein
MSQQLVPVNGGSGVIQITPFESRVNALSPQFVKVRKLESRPTEWVLEGRPIYRRLPAISETYQFDFFNVVPLANSAGTDFAYENIAFVYIPWGEGINGSISAEVISSDNYSTMVIKQGALIWEHGTIALRPALINLKEIELELGSYTVAYRLTYDNAPTEKVYSVEDYALTGLPLTITSSTDSVVGWRYSAINAFLNISGTFWKNTDTFFPTYAQPTSTFIQWTSTLSSAFSKIILRCPPNTAYSGSATLSYISNSTTTFVSTTNIASDSTGQFFEFNIASATFQTGWNVVWSNLDMAIEKIEVTGFVTRLTTPVEATTDCVLVIYPENQLPATITNSLGVDIDATYCPLAVVEVDNSYHLTNIRDKRYIVHRNYEPVSDWLTRPFDEDLIGLYETVKNYKDTWLSPTTCVKQEYAALTTNEILVEN